MSLILLRLLLFLISNNYIVEARLRNKFVHEKDISEHCMRRVMPSVFLGRHVVDAYSQVLYFSKVDLPYSCYVSVRAESGSNIILVVQLLSADDLIASCAENANQLLVYEMGETFGGYWGPMPQSFILPDRNMSARSTRSEVYTIKYVPERQPVRSTKKVTTVQSTTSEESTDSPTYAETQDYVTAMIPLVEISGKYEPGEENEERSAFEDENFDLIYDVLPRQKETYVTTVMPLVQFSVGSEPDRRRWGFEDLMSGYTFGQGLQRFTPDYRLKHQKYNESVNRRLKFKHNSSKRPHHDVLNSNMLQPIKHSKHVSIHDNNISVTTTENNVKETEYWKSIEELIAAYNNTGSLTTVSDDIINRDMSDLLNKLNALDKTDSAYLNFTFTSSLELTTKTTISPFTRKLFTSEHIMTQSTGLHHNNEEIVNNTMTSTKSTIAHNVEELQENTHNYIAHTTQIVTTQVINTETKDSQSDLTVTENLSLIHETMATKRQLPTQSNVEKNLRSPITGSLLDHESWENLVRAAPVMVGRLDEKVPQKIIEELEKNPEPDTSLSSNNTSLKNPDAKVKVTRVKRFIQGVMISEARPHKLTTYEEVTTTTSAAIHISDMQQFAELVELTDDHIHDRAALRYLSEYVGRPVFNLCNFEQPKPRYVQLFKSSRLVVAVNNFTLRRMQLVMTPAKLLFSGRSRCDKSHLECQISGNRVCIDSMSACDGVANCGSPDIYDEDRLMCGAYVGLRHNVCLAAITFLAVLLTLIYMVHYWLGRCVPKVSEAFFIYTEGDENILYLDTIMRSPNDMSLGIDTSKSFEAFEGDPMFSMETSKDSKIHSWLYKLFHYCCKKKAKVNMESVSADGENLHHSPTNTMYSFPELEIRKLNNPNRNMSVQTGGSLEMNNMSLTKSSFSKIDAEFTERLAGLTSPIISKKEQKQKYELGLLKYLNRNKNTLGTSAGTYQLNEHHHESITEAVTEYNELLEEEIEINNQIYEPRWNVNRYREQPGVSYNKYDVHTETPKIMPSKCLRFSEEVVNIPRIEAYEDDDMSDDRKNQDINNEPVASTSRDFKRFWGGTKKTKKKLPIQTASRK